MDNSSDTQTVLMYQLLVEVLGLTFTIRLQSLNNLFILPKSSDMLIKNTLGVKKVRGQEELATKSSDIN